MPLSRLALERIGEADAVAHFPKIVSLLFNSFSGRRVIAMLLGKPLVIQSSTKMTSATYLALPLHHQIAMSMHNSLNIGMRLLGARVSFAARDGFFRGGYLRHPDIPV
jgi:hypothetical protein